MNSTSPCIIDVAYGDACAAGLPISVGVPFRAGVLRDASTLLAIAPSGEKRPASGRTLAHWPDGSIRWCLISFGARESGAHELRWDETVAPTTSLHVEQNGADWTIDDGNLQVVLCETGAEPIRSLRCDGHEYLRSLAFTVDEASTQHETRRSIRVIEASPLRARLRVEGAHFDAVGSRHLSYRLDVEVWAGWPTVRLDYQFFNLEPGADFRRVERIALDAKWNLGAQTERHFLQNNYGEMYLSRHVYNPDPVALVTDFSRGEPHVVDAAMLLDDVDYPFYLHAPLVSTHDWLGVQDEQHAVYAQVHDFLSTRPNRLSSEGNGTIIEFWPQSAGPLELQQGRSKRHTVSFSFIKRGEQSTREGTAKIPHAPQQAATDTAVALGALCHEERACVVPAWNAHCGEYDQSHVLPFGQHVRIETNMHDFMKLDTPHSKFDVGDTNSHYASSYSVANEDLAPPLSGAPLIPRVWPGAAPTPTYLDCHEPVWTNNEYDAIHAFANETMRSGRHELLRALRLMARHNIEVDFLHYSDHRWTHRATPAHSARHTTTGAYPSHFWTQGLMEYYCMTGDEDALEVAVALADKTIESFNDPELRPVLWGFNREVGWSVLSLVHVYDITREARFLAMLDELVESLISFDRNSFSGAINLSAGNDRLSMNRQIVSNFFGYASMVDAIDLYATITQREDAIQWLKTFCTEIAEAGFQAAREGELPQLWSSILLCVGYERTGDKNFIDQMGLLLDQVYWKGDGLQSHGSIKPLAMHYRGWMRMLGHAQAHDLLDAYEYPSVQRLKS